MQTATQAVTPGVEIIKPRERDIDRLYRLVNEAWGVKRSELPPLSEAEAISATKRLWRVATGRRCPFKKFTFSTGNRHSSIWRGRINLENGWHGLVHSLSHSVYHQSPEGRRAEGRHHEAGHAYLERRLVEYVVSHGWLDGKLKRPEKPKPVVQDVRRWRVDKLIAKWEGRRRRAENALKKLKRKQKYYQRQAA